MDSRPSDPAPSTDPSPPPLLDIETVDLSLPLEIKPHPRFERPLQASVREARLLTDAPWVRSLGKLALEVTTEGWRFPAPPQETALPPRPRLHRPALPHPGQLASRDVVLQVVTIGSRAAQPW